ncbi:MAG: hypothetical protein K0S61_2349 [Anaerocolumna sp.]|jgi:hypothetical protein|nr:hypothetical protein [Anaerocolumna sp.]
MLTDFTQLLIHVQDSCGTSRIILFNVFKNSNVSENTEIDR